MLNLSFFHLQILDQQWAGAPTTMCLPLPPFPRTALCGSPVDGKRTERPRKMFLLHHRGLPGDLWSLRRKSGGLENLRGVQTGSRPTRRAALQSIFTVWSTTRRVPNRKRKATVSRETESQLRTCGPQEASIEGKLHSSLPSRKRSAWPNG